MSDDVMCLKHNSPTVALDVIHPEHGPLYQCLHDTGCTVAEPDGTVQTSWVADRAPRGLECDVFRCLEAPTGSVPGRNPGRKVVIPTCDAHAAAIRNGEPYLRRNGKLLMGEDYRIAKGL